MRAKQIGWSEKSNILYEILKQLDKLMGLAYKYKIQQWALLNPLPPSSDGLTFEGEIDLLTFEDETETITFEII